MLDDCLATPEAMRNEMVNRYYALGRHVNTSFIIISQHTASLLSPMIKANSDLICWSKLSRHQLEGLSDSCCNLSKKEFMNISEKMGGVNYSFMCLDNFINATDPCEFLTCVRAKPPK